MKKDNKGFTLIELLVVVAIIGNLAAVGTVAYNGYTTAAKNAAIKAQFKMIVKYFGAELQKCNLGEDKIFNQQVSCSSRFTRMPFGVDVEDALEQTFTRIGYKDRNGNTTHAVRGVNLQNSIDNTKGKSACQMMPDVFYGDVAFDMIDSVNPVRLLIAGCDVSGNYLESIITIE